MMLDSPNTCNQSTRRVRIVLLALFFCSGVSGLIFEVVWTRQLTVILGNTVYAVSTVLAAFMAGLALGSFLGGRFIDRRRDPLRAYAVLEVAIGASGFGLGFVLQQTGPVYVWIHQSLAEFPLLLSVTRYVFAFGLLVVPTTLMGATLPVLSRFVVASQREVGFDTGRLYSLNTLGAALGCYAAGFLLIGNLGIEATVRVASALSLAVGAGAWFCWKSLEATPPVESSPPDESEESESAWSPLRVVVLVAFAVSGLAALGYEVVWTRLLTPYLGNSVYAFSTMLAAFLIGLALGSLVFSVVASRSKRSVAILGIIEVGIALYVLFSIVAFAHSAQWLQAWMLPEPWWGETWSRFLKAFGLMFLPTFLMGAAFPMAGQVYVGSLRQLGQRLGELYACNTLGAILGAALAGFVLLPLCGMQGSLVVLLCLNLAVGLVLCAVEPAMRSRGRALLVAALAVTAGTGLAVMPWDVFRRAQEAAAPDEKLLYYNEDVLGTVTVREKGAERTLAIDNLNMAGTNMSCLTSQMPLGHLPMLLHPNPQTAYVLGFGGGGTTHAIATYPEVQRIDASELSRSVIDVAPLFDAINHNVIADPRLHVQVTDGRHFLLTTHQTFDVVSVDLLWPQTAGSGSLYTLEFYQLCHRRLNDDGIMIQWLHPGTIPPYYLQVIVRTTMRVFPHTSLWWAPGRQHVFVVASKSPLKVDLPRMAERMSQPDVRRDLGLVGLDDPAKLLALYIAHDDALAQFVADSDALNTDDLPLLEYNLPLYKGSSGPENLEALTELLQSVLPVVEGADQQQADRINASQQSNHLLCQGLIALRYRRPDVAVEKWSQAVQIDPANHEARTILEQFSRMLPANLAPDTP